MIYYICRTCKLNCLSLLDLDYKVNPLGDAGGLLHEHTSIFTAEAVALKLAVQHIQREAIRKSVIYSDSLSCLQTLQHKNLENPIIREIIHILSYLGEVGSQVEFCWIPPCWNKR